MSNNKNYNRNRHNGTDNNNQSDSEVHGGELKNGRLSQFKNHNQADEEIPNEYISNTGEEEDE